MYTIFIGEHSLEHFHKYIRATRASGRAVPDALLRGAERSASCGSSAPLFLCKALFCYKEKLSISIKSIYFIYRRLAK